VINVSAPVAGSAPCYLDATWQNGQTEIDFYDYGNAIQATVFIGTTPQYTGLLQPGTYDLGSSAFSYSVSVIAGNSWQGDPSGARSGVMSLSSVTLGAPTPYSSVAYNVTVHGTFTISGLVAVSDPADNPPITISATF
jgi:hypothetical protein